MENYNNHDIRIGALSDLDIKVKVNVNYVLTDFNYSLMNEDWDTQINFSNCEMVVGKGTEGEEVQLFMNVFEDFFENDMDMGGEWGFNSQEEREEFIKKSSC